MRQATLAPMATAPAVPPRTAEAPALDMTSPKERGSLFFSVVIVIVVEVLVEVVEVVVVVVPTVPVVWWME